MRYRYCTCTAGKSPRAVLEMSAAEELAEREGEAAAAVGFSALTILRHMSDHMPHLSLGVTARMGGTNDAVGSVLPLLMRPPWERRLAGEGGRARGDIERWEGGFWRRVAPGDRHVLCSVEAQAWLLLYNVLLDPGCARKLDFSESRVEALLRLRPRLTPQLLGQLPVLQALRRGLEELAMGAHRGGWRMPGAEAPPPAPRVVIEQAPALRAALLRDTDWVALAERQLKRQFGAKMEASVAPEVLRELLQGFDFLSALEPAPGGGGGGGADPCAPPPAATLEAYHSAGQERWDWHASYRLELRSDQAAEVVQVPGEPGGPPARAGSAAGRRHRLAALGEGSAKALPANGRLVLTYGGVSCEALLELPAPNTRWGSRRRRRRRQSSSPDRRPTAKTELAVVCRDTSALPPALWVTVGTLRGEGLALQLKVRRLDRAEERGGGGGGAWCAYTPVGGALSVRDGLLQAG
jgi:hypothetical protein